MLFAKLSAKIASNVITLFTGQLSGALPLPTRFGTTKMVFSGVVAPGDMYKVLDEIAGFP